MASQRILLIDASPAMRETAAAVLADAFDVTTAADGSHIETQAPVLAIIGTGVPPASLAADVPVLWLAPDPQWVPPHTAHRSATISRAFFPPELRAAVQRIIAHTPREQTLGTAVARLTHPFLCAPAVAIAQQAARTSLPVLIEGPRCTGRGSVAQAIHASGGRGNFMVVSSGSLQMEHLPSAEVGTICVDRIERLSGAQQDCLLGALQPDGTAAFRPGQRLRIIAATECGAAALLQDPHFSAELYYRLNVLALPLLPLRDRPQDIGPLAQVVGAELARSFGVAAVSFTPRALERLANYLWFGDVAELEAVLARTLALTRKELIDADDLRFGLSAADHGTSLGGPAHAAPPDVAALHTDALDLVINEIAHELKNPLVTIKTFAQHLRRLGSEGTEEQQLARLTGEAVDDIDHTVENLVQFTRLEEPVLEQVALPAVLAPAVATLTQLVRPRTRRVDYRPPPPVAIRVDRSQVTYGLNNLFRALGRGLGDTGRIVIGYEDPGCIVIELPTGFDPAEAHLAALLSGERRAARPLSLAAAIAHRVLEGNGGTLTFETARQPPRVTVRFPLSDVEEVPLARNVQTPRAGR